GAGADDGGRATGCCGAGCAGGAAGGDPGRGNGCGTGGCWSNAATINGNSMNPIIRLRDFCRAERAWLLDTIEALVRIESPSTDKAAVDRCGAELAGRLEAIGGRVTTLTRADRGDHLRAEFGVWGARGSSRADRQVLLLGHFDTVWPVGQL